MRYRLVGLFVVASIWSAVTWAIHNQWEDQRAVAQEEYVREAQLDTRNRVAPLEQSVMSIYENMRTLASLPGVRNLDRHATNLSAEARVTIQQVYNNLATSVAISEVYFTPIDFAPEKIDPITAKPEEPIIMFDELILNAGLNMSVRDRMSEPDQVKTFVNEGPPEVEMEEYLQLKDHAAWMKQKHSKSPRSGEIEIPFIAGPEVITCDNSHFIDSGDDADRSGIIFSVPFYDYNGDIRGLVSTIILTKALKGLLANNSFALVNTGNGYVASSPLIASLKDSGAFVRQGKPDPSLIYSEAIPFGVKDWRNPWLLWAGLPNANYEDSKNAVLADRTFTNNMILVSILAMAAATAFLFASRTLAQSHERASLLALDKSSAEKGEAEARETAEKFQLLNNDISRLNKDLSDKMAELRQAQQDIIKKAKLAQLGQLVATVAHEIRNPLGGIRTAAYLLQRKLRSENPEVSAHLTRLEAGIARCDDIITQLLDFSRPNNPIVENIVVDTWLEKIIAEDAAHMPADVTISLELGMGLQTVEMDSNRLRRAIFNLVKNSYESILDPQKYTKVPIGQAPTITISSRETPRGLEITVKDNGPGIPEDIIDRIRDPLFTTKSFGTGLGIPAVEKILELHKGGLDIETELGIGTKAILWLPFKQNEAMAA